ncbi:1-phosphofructokinase family hexose kinase [Microlunatus flavus]|uniref:1-phosphofructokinase/6-phosphofructokinase 2 n=1 Tax=Microlunatus flavus TaxID=1036181 RepID=A0A1H9ADA9_9ACTN|nr:PfkB family carbohydrate kinase [Microlunatus flavus]SEP73958.1 1-phosphofructokinase/6-phosphofructokinase 2 [Microlunatus flavus]
MIHALGLAPSLDVVHTVDKVVPGAIHRPRQVVRLAGGKSLNVARALDRLGHRVRAVAPLGGPLGDLVAELLEPTGVRLVRLTTRAKTRLCLTVADESAGALTEFYERAPQADGGELDQLEQALDAVETGDWLALSGSVPEGTDLDRLVGLLAGLRGRGARLAVDTHGAVLPLLVERATPDVVKINRAEAAELVGGEPEDLLELGAAVRDLGVGVLVLTDGADGAVGWDGSGRWRVRTGAAPGGYPVGSGDCFLAGLVGDLSSGASLPDALVTAAAVGAANAAVPGGALFDDDTLARLRAATRAVAV